ncbi:hypothetical protein UFOVP1623_21 [uncultured Caudovirales phage]|uniref:Uncharacterized protein n=1 Tax=uncultured Caudovirales phage TaxID=2100421 RepID=A0A6J5S3W8_9CAUD|nr:hypothetical protein UFOVP1376_42 [uncultured Caudovirales phage]CAB4220705.1 hypothetical protein UFOVP1623_21 [uncultured Caudovirales phage]
MIGFDDFTVDLIKLTVGIVILTIVLGFWALVHWL